MLRAKRFAHAGDDDEAAVAGAAAAGAAAAGAAAGDGVAAPREHPRLKLTLATMTVDEVCMWGFTAVDGSVVDFGEARSRLIARAIDRGDSQLVLHEASAFHTIAPAASAASLRIEFPAGDAPQVYAMDAATDAYGARLGAATAELAMSSLGVLTRSGKLTDRFNWWNALRRAAATGKHVALDLTAGGVQASTNMMPDCYGALPGMMSKLVDRQGHPAWLTKRYYARPTMPAFGQPLPARAGASGGLPPLKNDAFVGHRPGRHELCAGAAIGTLARLLKVSVLLFTVIFTRIMLTI